jgi:hypothetical protein
MGPSRPRSSVLTEAEELIVVEFRRRALLPLDDVLGCLRGTIPTLSRIALRRCLQRHGISRLPQGKESASKRRRSAETTIGYVHVDVCELRLSEVRLHMFLAIDRVSKFAHVASYDADTELNGAAFLREVVQAFPYAIRTVLTDNGNAAGRPLAFALLSGEAAEPSVAPALLEAAAGPGAVSRVVRDRGHSSEASGAPRSAGAAPSRSFPRARPAGPRRRTTEPPAAAGSRTRGLGSRSGARPPPATRTPPPATSATSTSPPPSTGCRSLTGLRRRRAGLGAATGSAGSRGARAGPRRPGPPGHRPTRPNAKGRSCRGAAA